MAPLSPLCLPCPHATHKRHHIHTTQHAHKRLIDRHARFPPRRRSRPHIRPSRLRTVTPPRFGTAALIQSHQPAIPLSPITRGTLSPPLLSVDSPPRALSPCATLGRDLWALRCGPARPHEGHEGEAPRPSLSVCVCVPVPVLTPPSRSVLRHHFAPLARAAHLVRWPLCVVCASAAALAVDADAFPYTRIASSPPAPARRPAACLPTPGSGEGRASLPPLLTPRGRPVARGPTQPNRPA